MNFNNKKILITGASQGLGAMIAENLSKYGAKLILVSSSLLKLNKTLNRCQNKKKHEIIVCDFLKNNEIKNLTDSIKKKYSNLDIVMHFAGGGMGIKDPLPKFIDYSKVFQLNLFSIMEINRCLFPLLKKSKKTTIFHVGSIAAKESVGSVSYNAAKSALNTYVRSLSKSMIKYNICVTGINPGGFEYMGNAMYRLKKNNPEGYKNFIKTRTITGKMPKANELLPIIITLISDNNFAYTGNMINCDFGEGNFY
jgi:uncharacterized protein